MGVLGLCLECYPGYLITSNGQCLAVSCNITNCLYCFGSSVCIVCLPGFLFDPYQNMCVDNSGYLSCRTSQNPYCTSCTGSTCLSCDYYATLIGNQCYCNIPGCLRCLGNSMCL